MNDRLRVFREESGFIKLFTQFKEKYRSLGRVGGTVGTHHFSSEEMAAIAGFMGKSAAEIGEKGTISLLAFEKALSHTSFADYAFIQLLEEVLGESIRTKREEELINEEKERNFFQALYTQYPEGDFWWEWIRSKQADTRWIWAIYKQNPTDLHEKLIAVLQAFQLLTKEKTYEKLPLFAQRATGNPHYFDQDQLTGKLLIHCLHVDQAHKGLRQIGMPKTTEEVGELYSHYGLMKDDLWSFVTCRGLLAEGETGIHPVWQAAAETNTVLNVPIKELIKVGKIWPAKGNQVWIVENSSVCSTIVDQVPEAPIMCTHGQFRTASLVMLDLLVQAGCTLYYSGDIDPEGLTMAQRLKDRYGNQLTLWRMDQDSYKRTLSEEDISARLTKLDAITAPELEEVVKVLKDKKKAGYQEGLVAELTKDIQQAFEREQSPARVKR